MSFFPNVPNLPGVPQLPRSPLFPPSEQALLGIVEGALWDALTLSPPWGIYPADSAQLNPSSTDVFINSLVNAVAPAGLGSLISGNAAILADSCISVTGTVENKVSDFPVEGGAFATYNKVLRPAKPIVRLAKSGGTSAFNEFLTQIDTLTNNTTLVNVVTDGFTYTNCTIESYRYTRSASQGATLVQVDIHLVAVNQVAAYFSSTINSLSPSAQSPVNTGTQQAVTPSEQTQDSLIEEALY